MLYLVVKTVVLSAVFIFIVHQSIRFLTDRLTVPKTKDLVSIIEKKYDEIHRTLQIAPRLVTKFEESLDMTTKLNDLPSSPSNNNVPNICVNEIIDKLITNTQPQTDPLENMKTELQLFIKQQAQL
jgi:hypothetical protein